MSFTYAIAHQPKLIKYSPSSNKPHNVIEPEISKAYYGKLIGAPHYYKIESNIDFFKLTFFSISSVSIFLKPFDASYNISAR